MEALCAGQSSAERISGNPGSGTLSFKALGFMGQSCKVQDACLVGADLREAKGLTATQVEKAILDPETLLPQSFVQRVHPRGRQ